MKFGKINRLLIFGGTPRVGTLIESCLNKYEIVVFSNERLLNEKTIDNNMSLKEYLELNKVRFYSVIDINNFPIDEFMTDQTLGISLGAPWIFKEQFINKFNRRLINGHGSNLPRDQGAGGFSWRILQKDKFGFYLFHIVDSGVDTGNIIISEQYLFPDYCRKPIDYIKFHQENELGFFCRFFELIENNYDFTEIIQQKSFSTYFPRLNTVQHGFINWSWQTEEIIRFINAFDDPYPGASTFLRGIRVHIKDVLPNYNEGSFHPFICGIIYRQYNGKFYVATLNGSVVIGKVLDESGNSILPEIKAGERFYTPSKYLDMALEYVAKY